MRMRMLPGRCRARAVTPEPLTGKATATADPGRVHPHDAAAVGDRRVDGVNLALQPGESRPRELDDHPHDLGIARDTEIGGGRAEARGASARASAAASSATAGARGLVVREPVTGRGSPQPALHVKRLPAGVCRPARAGILRAMLVDAAHPSHRRARSPPPSWAPPPLGGACRHPRPDAPGVESSKPTREEGAHRERRRARTPQDPAQRVKIFDTTLRDGEQSPGIHLNTREKVEIAQQLARLGVNVIEAGFPITSPGDFEAVRAVAAEVEGVDRGRPRARERARRGGGRRGRPRRRSTPASTPSSRPATSTSSTS